MRMQVPFGKPITAREIEEFATREDEVAFVRLANAILASALADLLPGVPMPACSERVNVPDGGVDSEVNLAAGLALPEAYGLLGPGRTVYQFKWRDLAARKRSEILRELSRSAVRDVAKLKVQGEKLPDRYVLLANLHLTAPQTRQLRQAILAGCPELSEKVIAIWGAGEIAAYINTHPQVRHAFFSQGAFCTIGVAVQELKNQYKGFPWVDLVGRDAQVEAVREFVTRGSDRVLLVAGSPYVGKTRAVLEALALLEGRVLWASHPELVAEDHLRDLDQEKSAVLVLDNCERDVLERALRWATSRSRLQTILISRHLCDWPGLTSLVIGPLDDAGAGKLLATSAPRLPSIQQSWLDRLTGGVPGLIVYAAGQVVPDRDLTDPAADATACRQILGRLISQRILAGATPEERRTLHAVSMLTQIGIKDSAQHELDAVSQALGYDASEVRSILPTLLEKGIVTERGRFVEVAPPLLAETLAAEAVMGRPLALPSLLIVLDEGARLRFLSRFRNIGGSEEVDRSLASIFSSGGWFPDLESLLDRSREFRSLAPGYPAGAAACLHRLLTGQPVLTLKERVAGSARREVVWALSDLSLGRDTFQESAETLLCLAEAENEQFDNNATGIFRNIFHAFHPEVACSLPERLQFLAQAGKSKSAERRRLVASAVGSGASTDALFILHHPEGPEMPDAPGVPKTPAEVRTYFLGLLQILAELSRDLDEGVRVEARNRLISGCREFLPLGQLDEDGAVLADRILVLLRDLAAQAKEARVVADFRSELEMLLQEIESTAEEALSDSRKTELLSAVRERVLGVLGELTDNSYPARLKRWAGPHSWKDELAEFSAAEGGSTPSQAALRILADEAVQDPSLVDDLLLEWLLGPEARQAAWFFVRIGERDSVGAWRDRLIQKLDLVRGPESFGWYVSGWARRDRREAEEFLDGMLIADPEKAKGILAATLRIEASASGVDRILRLLSSKKLQRNLSAQELAWGWTDPLCSEDFARLVKGLDDGSWETGLALLDVLAYRLLKVGVLSGEIGSTIWSILERTGSVKTDHQAHNWDRLAAHLAVSDPNAVLDLIERLARREPSPSARAVFEFLRIHGSTWKVLAQINRPAFVERLLRISVPSKGNRYWVHWCARRLIDPSQDRDTLLEFARNNGDTGALAVVDLLDSSKPGFWELAREILVSFGDSERVAGRLASCVYRGRGGWGSRVPVFEEKRKQAARFAEDPDPRVSRWASRLARELAGEAKVEERRDQEDFLWDYDVKRSDLIEMLQDKKSPDRLWAIQRILLHAPREEAIRLLTVDEIREALPHVELPDRVRRIWEAYVANWSHRG